MDLGNWHIHFPISFSLPDGFQRTQGNEMPSEKLVRLWRKTQEESSQVKKLYPHRITQHSYSKLQKACYVTEKGKLRETTLLPAVTLLLDNLWVIYSVQLYVAPICLSNCDSKVFPCTTQRYEQDSKANQTHAASLLLLKLSQIV